MEKLLERYLKSYHNWEHIYIGNYNVDGTICAVTFYTDENRYCKETTNINIWEMFVFLNVT